jgi:hypothetical protein
MSKQDFLHLHCKNFGLKMSAYLKRFLYVGQQKNSNKQEKDTCHAKKKLKNQAELRLREGGSCKT